MYIYNDEDNVPMNDEAFTGYQNVYGILSEVKTVNEEIPFTDLSDSIEYCEPDQKKTRKNAR